MPLKILVIEDERHIVRLIQVNLERQGYQVITAFEGKEGLEKIRSEKPALVILKCAPLPDMNGIEVLRATRAEPETEELPVIAFVVPTGSRDDDKVWGAYNSGADLVLTRPFNPMELIGYVKRLTADQPTR